MEYANKLKKKTRTALLVPLGNCCSQPVSTVFQVLNSLVFDLHLQLARFTASL